MDMEDGQYGLLDTNDLLGSSDLLPDGTRVFSSTYTYSRLFWKLGAATLLMVLVCFFGVIGTHVSTPPGTIFLILFFLFLVFGLSVMFWTHKMDEQTYLSQATSGTWHRGIIVFQNGTVVYRTKTLMKDKEITFEASEIEEIGLTNSYSLGKQLRSCGGNGEPDRQYLHFSILPRGSRSTIQNYYIDCSEIRESGSAVVEYIKEVQLRTSPSLVSY